MFVDFVVKKEDEKFLSLAKKLGFFEVYFINVITVNTLAKLKDSVDKTKELIVVQGGNSLINRAALENKKIDILLSPEKGKKKDFIHHRDSGLNHILCKLAAENKVAIGFSFFEILNSKGVERAQLIGRMMQNVRLCRRYKVKMCLGSFATELFEMRDIRDLMAVGRILGMTPGEAKAALSFKKEEREF